MTALDETGRELARLLGRALSVRLGRQGEVRRAQVTEHGGRRPGDSERPAGDVQSAGGSMAKEERQWPML